MRRSFITGLVLVGTVALFAGGNLGQASSKSWQSNAVKAILATNAGHHVKGLLPSGAFQEAVESGLLHVKIPKGAKPMGTLLPSSEHTLGCSNTYTKTGRPNNVRANQICDLRRQAEVQVAADPATTKYIAIGQNDSRLGYNRQGLDYSHDHGAHWGDYQPPTTQVDCTPTGACVSGQWTYDAVSDPAVAWGPNGEMYYGLLGFDFLNDGYTSFWMLRSNAGNKGTFLHSPDDADNGSFVEYADTPVGLIHDNFSNPALSDDKEFIAVDTTNGANRGNVYAVWTIFNFGCTGGSYCSSPIFFSKSTDGGATWNCPPGSPDCGIADPGPPVEISGNNPTYCNFGDLFDPSRDPHDCDFDQGAWPVVGPDGTIYVVYNNCNTSENAAEGFPAICQQLMTKSADGGATWSGPAKVADDYSTEPLNLPPDECPPGLCGTMGNGCPVGRQCLPPQGYRVSNFPSMGIDRQTGKLVAFWSDFRNGSYTVDSNGNVVCTPCNEDVFISESTDGGVSWSGATAVTTHTAAEYYPWGDVDDSGNLYVGYYTRQYGSCESTGCQDFKLSSSSDDGASFTNQRVTTSSMPNLTPDNNPFQAGFIGDYNSITVAGGNVYMAWADTRGLNDTVEEDAYFAKVATLP